MRNVYLRKALVAAIALWFLAAPLYSFVGKGPFSWHIKQPAAYQGGAEVLALIAVFYLALSISNRGLRIALGAFGGWLFARRHGVDFSILLVYLYAESIFALGNCLIQRTGMLPMRCPTTAFAAGLLGTIAWSLVIWSLSALGLGSLEAIRLTALVVLGMAIAMSNGPRMATLVFHSMRTTERLGRFAVAVLGAFFLALFAKASVATDYDSLWYGLQAEEVLVGGGNIYAAQGLASVAHYYPKLYEALQLPFAGLGSVSLISGMGIFSCALLVLTALAILREFHVDKTLRLCGAALVATLPALANTAITAKGDVFAAWLLLMSLLAVVRYRKGLGVAWMWIALSALVLSMHVRLVTIPYAAILFLILCYSFAKRWRTDGGTAVFLDKGVWFAAAAALLSGFVVARSLLLAGVVLVAPNSLVMIQQAVGLTLKYPVGLLPASAGMKRLPLLDGFWNILFDPAQYAHLIITWTGNVWLFLPIAVVLLGGMQARRRADRAAAEAWPLLAVGLAFFVFMFGIKQYIPGSDGNYVIVPVVCLILWGLIQADKLPSGSMRRYVSRLSVPFVLCGAAISFVTGSWGPGTRAFDRVMTRVPFEYAQYADQGLKSAHMQGVARYFSDMPRSTRVVGLESDSAVAPGGWWLSVQYEPLQPYAWQQPALVASSSAFEQYLQQADIQYVITPKKKGVDAIDGLVRASLGSLAARQEATIAYEDDHYQVWKLKYAYGVSASLSGGGTARVDTDPEQFCRQPQNGVAIVAWAGAPGNVAIEVKSAETGQATLWAEAGSEGKLVTGPWVSAGSEFVFRRGRGGSVIGRIAVSPHCGQ